MTPIKEIGECLITDGDIDYFFRPSFAAMMRIGEPVDIVQAFYDVHIDELTPELQRLVEAYGRIPEWAISYVSGASLIKTAARSAIRILQACCDQDISKLTGELRPSRRGKSAFVYKPGSMPVAEMIICAQSLITHGVIGKAKVRQLQRDENNATTTEFKAVEYINSARNHFQMSRAEAEQLTMTEFAMLIASKYPEQKGYTREEYDKTVDDVFAARERRRAKENKTNSQ